MDLWGVRLLLLGDLSVFKDNKMTAIRIETSKGYFDYKIKTEHLRKS